MSGRAIIGKFAELDSKDRGMASLLMFFVPFGIWMAAKILYAYTSFAGPLKMLAPLDYVRFACLGVLFVREILFGKWDRIAFVGLLAFGFLGAMAFRAHWNHLIDGAAIVFAARNVDFKILARFCLVELSALLIIVIASSLAGIVPDHVYPRNDGELRHTFGFAWPNNLGGIAVSVLCLCAFLRGRRYSWPDALGSLAVVALLYFTTYSRAACVAGIALILAMSACRLAPQRMRALRVWRWAGIAAIPVIALTGALLAIQFDPAVTWMAQLDQLLSSRLTLAHNAIVDSGIPFMGQKRAFGGVSGYSVTTGEWVNRNTALLVDCIFPKLLVHCGWAFFALSILLCTLACARACAHGQWPLVVAAFVLALYGLSEPYVAYLHVDPFLFCLGSMFYRINPTSPRCS